MYGIVSGRSLGDRLVAVSGMVEKPRPEDAPSNNAIIGRYILTPDIFPILEQTPPTTGGEIQITDALKTLLGRECPSTATRSRGSVTTRATSSIPEGHRRARCAQARRSRDRVPGVSPHAVALTEPVSASSRPARSPSPRRSPRRGGWIPRRCKGGRRDPGRRSRPRPRLRSFPDTTASHFVFRVRVPAEYRAPAVGVDGDLESLVLEGLAAADARSSRRLRDPMLRGALRSPGHYLYDGRVPLELHEENRPGPGLAGTGRPSLRGSPLPAADDLRPRRQQLLPSPGKRRPSRLGLRTSPRSGSAPSRAASLSCPTPMRECSHPASSRGSRAPICPGFKLYLVLHVFLAGLGRDPPRTRLRERDARPSSWPRPPTRSRPVDVGPALLEHASGVALLPWIALAGFRLAERPRRARGGNRRDSPGARHPGGRAVHPRSRPWLSARSRSGRLAGTAPGPCSSASPPWAAAILAAGIQLVPMFLYLLKPFGRRSGSGCSRPCSGLFRPRD